MRIIDKNKDYYDYLQGVIGIDEFAVYDRRGSVTNLLGKYLKDENWRSVSFQSDLVFSDSPSLTYQGLSSFSVGIYLLTGFRQYVIEIDHVNEKGKVKKFYRVVTSKLITRSNVVPSCPIIMTGCYFPKARWFNPFPYDEAEVSSDEYSILNPILKNTFIPSLISPDRIFNDVSDYLLATREKKIEDRRTDAQHIVSAGFDLKSSFRKVK